MAEKVDISKNYLSKVERGICKLNVEVFLKIVEVLGISLNDFRIATKKTPIYNKKQQELINKILKSPNEKIEKYAKFINFADEILSN